MSHLPWPSATSLGSGWRSCWASLFLPGPDTILWASTLHTSFTHHKIPSIICHCVLFHLSKSNKRTVLLRWAGPDKQLSILVSCRYQQATPSILCNSVFLLFQLIRPFPRIHPLLPRAKKPENVDIEHHMKLSVAPYHFQVAFCLEQHCRIS